jgi:para-nitrobenzyl esterase
VTAPSTTVRVGEGLLAGVASADGRVRAFKGIPYARPPVGARRWQPPQPPLRWDGVRPAATFGATCPQFAVRANSLYAGGHERQSEDCLSLNVWTAAESIDERRPVMVWFHLGAFQFGGASVALYDGEQLARAGVVVVTVNHRLGRLGFLAHPELSAESAHHASGNYGIHDLVQALRWLAENVAAFGGDPERVTIFGLSAGSMSVSMLMASPLARGLFHRAIGHSGASLGPVGASCGITDSMQDLPHAEQTGRALAKSLGVSTVEELRRLPAEALMLAPLPTGDDRWTFDAVDAPFSRGGLDSSFPIVDGHLLPESPFAIFSEGRQAPVPLITGSVAGEGSGMPYMADAARFVADSRKEYGEDAAEFLALYPATDDEQARVSSGAANGDRVFVWQNWTWARLHAARDGPPSYYYHFSHAPPLPADAVVAEQSLGAFHGAEIPYVFRHLAARDWPWTPYDHELSEVISSYWTRFAAAGDPNGPGAEPWPRFGAEAPVAMHFGEAVRCGAIPRAEQLAFWDAYYARRRSASRSTR